MADIELVIKMPENTYRQIQALARNNYFEHDICGNSMRRIANGTPIPKGHGKIIDATFALEAKITKDNIGVSERTKGWNEACQAIYENASAIIEADKEKKVRKKI